MRIAICFLLLSGFADAAVSLPAVLSDGMVLQRDTEVALWGWARPGEEVVVSGSWGGDPVSVVTSEDGRFECRLATPAAGGPHSVTFKGESPVIVRDVMVGEVWLASGQSNMEWPVRASQHAAEELALAAAAGVRCFQAPNRPATSPRLNAPGSWVQLHSESAKGVSAVAFAFSRILAAELGVPVGFIQADWGGTPVESWMSTEALEPFGQYAERLEWLRSMEDPVQRAAAERDVGEGWWRRLDKLTPPARRWIRADFDDSKWEVAAQPASFSGELGGFDGLVMMRRAFEWPEGWAGKEAALELGPIDDYDDVWVNGKLVGGVHEPGRWNQPRRYEIPAGLLVAGANVVAVRVLDTGGLGGFGGTAAQMQIACAGEADGSSVALSGDWRIARGKAASDLPARREGAEIHQRLPSVLWNGMMAPLVPFSLGGAIWYQGESNVGGARDYQGLFAAMIGDWRARFATLDLPFLFVQIAPHRYQADSGNCALLREAQAGALDLPRTGMAVTLDLGDFADIHPRNKREVGRRLALMALADRNGASAASAMGPVLREMQVGDVSMRLAFDHVAGGLELREHPNGRFLLAGDDRRFYSADARVEGDTLLLTAPEVGAPVAARYAWEAAPGALLFGGDGLPAAPFRTDDWDDSLPPADNGREMEQWRGADAGFAPLFDGKSLSGWMNVNCAPDTWTARDGVIACTGVPTGILCTEKMYENYVLELEYRHLLPGGNAGLFVWSDPITARGVPFARSVEVQVMDGRQADWFTSDGDVFPIHGATMIPEGGEKSGRAFPQSRRANAAPFWNHYRVTCTGGELTLALNGAVVTRGHAASPRKGYICLESEGSPVEFRNLRILELPPADPSLAEEHVALAAMGFEPLYTGVDLAGWKATDEHRNHWKAADWRLECDGGGPQLASERELADLVLVLDWRLNAPDARLALGLRGDSASAIELPTEHADVASWNRTIISLAGTRLDVETNGQKVIEGGQWSGGADAGSIVLLPRGGGFQLASLLVREP